MSRQKMVKEKRECEECGKIRVCKDYPQTNGYTRTWLCGKCRNVIGKREFLDMLALSQSPSGIEAKKQRDMAVARRGQERREVVGKEFYLAGEHLSIPTEIKKRQNLTIMAKRALEDVGDRQKLADFANLYMFPMKMFGREVKRRGYYGDQAREEYINIARRVAGEMSLDQRMRNGSYRRSDTQ